MQIKEDGTSFTKSTTTERHFYCASVGHMPVCCHSTSRQTRGFSIDDIIKHEDRSKPSDRLFSSNASSSPRLLPLTNNYQFHRDYMLQYFRQMNHFADAGMATALLLNSYRKPKRNRTAFTPSQLLKLENAFEKNHYIVGQERKDLARHLNLPEARVKVWYQNRRTKHKRASSEDGQSSVNDMDTSGSLIKNDDERSWIQEEQDNDCTD